LPFNGASIIARVTVDPKSPNKVTTEQFTKTVKVLMNIPQPYYNHYGGIDRLRARCKLYIGKGDAGWKAIRSIAGQSLNVLWGQAIADRCNDVPDDAAYAIPKDQSVRQADKAQLMSLFGIN